MAETDTTVVIEPQQEEEPTTIILEDAQPSKPEDKKPEVKEESADEVLAQMRQSLEAATEARKRAEAAALAAQESANRRLAAQQHAERIAAERTQEVQRARTQANEAAVTAISNALANAEKTREALQAQYGALGTEGNWAEQAKVSAALAEVSAQIVGLRSGKVEAEHRQKVQPVEDRQQQYQPPVDPRSQQDEWLSTQDPYNASWIRSNREKFFNDPSFQSKAVNASGYAVNVKGLQVGSAEYFQFIDEAVGLRQQQAEAAPRIETRETTKAETKAAVVTPRATPTAPPSRALPTTTSKGVSVTLSDAERKHARATLTPDIIGDRDPERVFAEHKARLMAEGRWSGEKFIQ